MDRLVKGKIEITKKQGVKVYMKLYLSSYKVGNKTEELKKWILENNNKIAIIANARDHYKDKEKAEQGILKDIEELEKIGFKVSRLDLKDYFNKQEKLKEFMQQFKAVYVIGGNTFVLRRAMKISGFDKYIKEKVNDSKFLYSGYSAGICVLAPSMEGIKIMDLPETDPYNYGSIIYEGIGLLDYTPIPHYQSDHFETELANKAVEYCKEKGIIYKTLQDGDVFIYNKENLDG